MTELCAFLLGVFAGGLIALFTIGLCIAAERGDKE